MARRVKEASALRTSDIKKLNKELEQQDKILASIDGRTKEAQQAAQKRFEIEQKLAGVEGQRASLGKTINDISKYSEIQMNHIIYLISILTLILMQNAQFMLYKLKLVKK